MSHTPGPWRYSINTRDTAFYVMADKPRFILETSWNGMEQGYFPNRETAEANARLASAAPELLQGCIAALGAFERNDCINWDDLRRAIEKATQTETAVTAESTSP